MQTYKIPNTDLEVSRLAYGTWHLGGSWDRTPLTQELKDRANRLLQTAVEQGITLIDLADIYTLGKSEELVAYALQQNPGMRDKLVLQAKAGIRFANDPNPGDPGRYDFSYEHLVNAVEGTLRRLQTDHVEVLLLHRPDALVEPEEVARAFDHLQRSGKVGAFGVSNHSAAQIALLQAWIDQPLVFNQVELNLLHHYMISEGLVFNNEGVAHVGAGGTLDYCRLNDIVIQAWSPVAGGKLFNPPADAPQNIRDAAREIEVLAEKYQTTKEAIALAWLLRHPAGIQPILGTLNADRLVDSCRADSVTISREEWYRLLEKARGKNVP